MSVLNSTTSTTRPSNPSDGELFFETDTRKLLLWDGSAWREYDNTSGATSGGGTGSGTGSGDSGSGSGDSGSGSGDSGTGGDGGITPGSGTGIETGLSPFVAQPGASHPSNQPLGDDSSGTANVWSIDTSTSAPMVIGSRATIPSIERYSTEWNSNVLSFWFRWDQDYVSGSPHQRYYLFSQGLSGGSNIQTGNKFYVSIEEKDGEQDLAVELYGTIYRNLILHQGSSHVRGASHSTARYPYDPITMQYDDASFPPNRNETSDWQVTHRPFHKGRWYNLIIHFYNRDIADSRISADDQNGTRYQILDYWLNGVKESTQHISNPKQFLDTFIGNPTYYDNAIVGYDAGTDRTYSQSDNDPRFPGLIQRFTSVRFKTDANSPLPETAIKELYNIGATASNPSFYDMPNGSEMQIMDALMGDTNTIPGEGNSIPIYYYRNTKDSSGSESNADPTIVNKFAPSFSNESFNYVKNTFDKPYTIAFGNWKNNSFSDGILNTNYRNNFSSGATIAFWFNINNVDKPGIHYLFGARNGPNVEETSNNDPDQFAVGYEGTSTNGTLFKLYYKQSDNSAQVSFVHSGEWHHLALTIDNSNNMFFYINGTKVTEYTGIPTAFSGNLLPDLYIGDANGGNAPFEGALSRVKFVQRGLDATEIDNIYKIGPDTDLDPFSLEPELNYALDGRLTNNGSSSYDLTYTGTGQPKYARNRPY